jgi:hypothetical protein
MQDRHTELDLSQALARATGLLQTATEARNGDPTRAMALGLGTAVAAALALLFFGLAVMWLLDAIVPLWAAASIVGGAFLGLTLALASARRRGRSSAPAAAHPTRLDGDDHPLAALSTLFAPPDPDRRP